MKASHFLLSSNARTFIDNLRRDYKLDYLFSLDAQVSERYNIAEHTERVLNQFINQRNFYQFSSEYSEQLIKIKKRVFTKVIIEDLFVSALSLHDIGKGLGPKLLQHEFTLPYLIEYLSKWGYSSELIQLAIALVNHDLIGETIQGKIAIDNAAISIQEKAKYLDMNIVQFFELQKLFYISDASSYDFLKNKVFKREDMSSQENKEKLVIKSHLFNHLEEIILLSSERKLKIK